MRSRVLAQVVIVAVIATIGFTGCKHRTGKSSTTAPGGGEAGTVPPLGTGGTISSSERPLAPGEWKHGQFDAEIVYFEYDSSRVKPSEVAKLETVAAYLKSHANTKLVIEGHADERGTAEYNRALSERRALACREEIVRLGANADNISTVGYGKERPAVTGHDEAAWAKNRRCEFAIAGP